MVRGQVNAHIEAVIPIEIHGPSGQSITLDGTIDTGFSGFLVLPTEVVSSLSLPYDRTEIFTLGEDSDVEFDLYLGTLSWDGLPRGVFVLASAEALVGMQLLKGHTLYIDVVDGGEVQIEPRQS